MRRLKIGTLALLMGLSSVYPVCAAPSAGVTYAGSIQQVVPIKPLTFKDKLKLDKDPQLTFILKYQKLGPFLNILAEKADLNLVNLLSVEKSEEYLPNLSIRSMSLSEIFDLIFTLKGIVAKRVNTNLIVATRDELPSLGIRDETLVRYYPIMNAQASDVFDQLKKILPLMNISVKEPTTVKEESEKRQQEQQQEDQKQVQGQGQLQAQLQGQLQETPVKGNLNYSGSGSTSKTSQQGSTDAELNKKVMSSTQKVAALSEVDLATIDIDKRLNALIVIGSTEVIDIINSILPSLDKPLPQVMIEVKIVGLSSTGSKKLGFEYGLAEKKLGVGLLGNAAVPGGNADGIPTTPSGGSSITFNALGDFTAHLNAKIDALVMNGEGKILSHTRVAAQAAQFDPTRIGKNAKITVTDSFPTVATTTAMTASTQTVTWQPVGEILNLNPLMVDTENGFITMYLNPKISNKGKELMVNGNPSYEIQAREVETTMRVKDGESIVIGGLKRTTKSSSNSKVPFLGDIPLLGSFFTNTSQSEEETEVIIIVTPHITTEKATVPNTP